jgi:hypothetical protein
MTGFRKIIMMALQKDMDKYLTIEPLEDNFQIQFYNECNAQYSLNGGLWAPFGDDYMSPIMNVGDKLYVKCELEPGYGTGQFYTEQSFDLSGNCNSLIFGDNAHLYDDLTGYSGCYSGLFYNCVGLRNVSKDFLPATTLEEYCYQNMFDSCESLIKTPELPATTLADECYAYMFSWCTSLVTPPELPATTLATSCYAYMFYDCSSLTTAPELPATTLADNCYDRMFEGCTSLASAPALPATTLAEWCYSYMFYGTNVLPDCTNIDFTSESVVASGGLRGLFAGTKVTDEDLYNILHINSSTGKYWLPVTTLTNYCYDNMFGGCSSLVTAPELPATTLAEGCYYSMFQDCTSLVATPVLPATTLAENCYQYMFGGCKNLTTINRIYGATMANYCCAEMFHNCTSLTTPPDLRSLYLADNCYAGMFDGCSNLTSTPALPAENVPYGAYASMFRNCYKLTNVQEIRAKSIGEKACQYMFSGCISLETMPELSITTLGTYCCREMFYGCTRLITIPILPATTLANYCYHKMFYGCSRMASSPVLPAKTLVTGCYQYMFQNCTTLKKITALFTTSPTSSHTQSWVSGVASNGIFLKGRDATWNVRGTSGVPTNWDFIQDGYENDYVCIESVDGRNINVSWSQNSSTGKMYYSFNALDWTEMSGQPGDASAGSSKIYLKGEGLTPLTSGSYLGMGKISVSPVTTMYKLSGNSMSLLFGDNGYKNTSLSGKDYAFYGLFTNNQNLTSISKDFLPATTLSSSCYRVMFDLCGKLTNIPDLPATTLKSYCYAGMFQNCNSLTDLSNEILPSKTLAQNCYASMFFQCTNLTHAPELPATTLVTGCYSSMFYTYSSAKLKYINAAFVTTPSDDYTMSWVSGAASKGVFIKNKNATWTTTGANAIPAGWTVYNEPLYKQYLTIEALEDGLTAKLSTNSCQYTLDGITWTTLAANTNTPSVNKGQKIHFRGNLTPTTSAGIGTFTISKKCNILGNAMSMLFGDNASSNLSLSGKNYAFYKLFYNCTNIVNVNPDLLPATTLSQSCYRSMFQGCTSLVKAPELPARTLQSYCYYYMFYGCSSLTVSPVLYGSTLVSYCYGYMFANCSKLNTITALFSTTPSSSYTGNWVSGVASSGTFYKNPNLTTTLPNAHYAVPAGWIQKPHSSGAGGGAGGDAS